MGLKGSLLDKMSRPEYSPGSSSPALKCTDIPTEFPTGHVPESGSTESHSGTIGAASEIHVTPPCKEP